MTLDPGPDSPGNIQSDKWQSHREPRSLGHTSVVNATTLSEINKTKYWHSNAYPFFVMRKVTFRGGNIMEKIMFIVSLLFLIDCDYACKVHADVDPKQRAILTLLSPYIQEEINDYYKDKLNKLPTFAPFLGGNTLNIKTSPSHFDVYITVIPFVGPHLDVGKDAIHFRINNIGEVKVVNFRHIENYKLPYHWRKKAVK